MKTDYLKMIAETLRKWEQDCYEQEMLYIVSEAFLNAKTKDEVEAIVNKYNDFLDEHPQYYKLAINANRRISKVSWMKKINTPLTELN